MVKNALKKILLRIGILLQFMIYSQMKIMNWGNSKLRNTMMRLSLFKYKKLLILQKIIIQQ